MSIITIDQLSKTFQTPNGAVEAVRSVTLTIAKGELFGLFGSNGAGKSTLVRMLTTLLLPTSGTATVNGWNVVSDALRVRESVGLVNAQERSFYGRLSPIHNLSFFAAMQNVPRRQIADRVAYVLDLFDLTHKAHTPVQSLSTGQQQRLNIARALIHDPDIIFFDEPTKSMDVRSSDIVKTQIREQLVDKEQKTVVYISHELYEMDNFCDRVVILADGQIQALGTPDQLGTLLPRRALYSVVVEGDAAIICQQWEQLPNVELVEEISRGITLTTFHVGLVDETPESWFTLIRTLADCGGRLESYERVDDASLRRIVSHFTQNHV